MTVKNEIREERTDVFSFWDEKKVLNELDEIIVINKKIDETTALIINDRIESLKQDLEEVKKQLTEIPKRIELEKTKLELIASLEV